MQAPKILQNIKSRVLTTGLTTVGAVGLSGYLASLAQSGGTPNAEATAITLLAGVFAASAPKLLDVILGVTSNIISSDLYQRFTDREIYKQIPPEANLYHASFLAFQSVFNDVIEKEKTRADQKQVKALRDISVESWIELVALDEQTDNVSEVAKEVLGKFADKNLIENQFLQEGNAHQENLLSRQDWLILLLRLQGKEDAYLTSDLEEKILDALEKDFTERLRSVFSAHQATFQEITLQLWETLFGKLEDIHDDLKETKQEVKDFRQELRDEINELKQIGQTNIQISSINDVASTSDSFIAYSKLSVMIANECKNQSHHFTLKNRHRVKAEYLCGNAKYWMRFSKKIINDDKEVKNDKK